MDPFGGGAYGGGGLDGAAGPGCGLPGFTDGYQGQPVGWVGVAVGCALGDRAGVGRCWSWSR